MTRRLVILSVILTCVLVSFVLKRHAVAESAESIHAKPISKAALDVLQRDLRMSDVLAIIKASPTRTASKEYLRSQQRLKLFATQEQSPMVLDGYTIVDLSSPIVGYSLFYHGSAGPLLIADASVNPTQSDAVQSASQLVTNSLDSIANPDGSRMYFLGIYQLDSSRVIKVMIRKAETPMGPDYAVRYAVSQR